MRSVLKSAVTVALLGASFHVAAPARAFDLEDYATTYRATRDAYLKAVNELKLALRPFEEARRPLLMLGFDLYAGEKYWFPLENYINTFEHFGDLTGDPCSDANGAASDAMCNPDAVCDPVTKTCGPSSSPYANVDLKSLQALWTTAIRYVDTVGTPPPMTVQDWDPWANAEESFLLTGANELGSAQMAVGTGWWSTPDYDIQDFFMYMRERRDRYLKVVNERALAEQVDVHEGSDGYFHPSLPSATCVLDPVLDHAIVSDMATQYRATRDAMLKAANEVKLALGPFEAALDAYQVATQVYTDGIACTDPKPAFTPPSTWICGARAFPFAVRCACSSGRPELCTGTDAVVVNENVPTVPYQMCKGTAPAPGERCLCVHDGAGSPCAAGSPIRQYSLD